MLSPLNTVYDFRERRLYTQVYALKTRAPVHHGVSRLSCILESRRCEGVYCLYAWPILHTHTHTHTHTQREISKICIRHRESTVFTNEVCRFWGNKCVFIGRYRVSGGLFLTIIWYYCEPWITVIRISVSSFYVSGRSPWNGTDSSQGIYSVIVWREQVRPW